MTDTQRQALALEKLFGFVRWVASLQTGDEQLLEEEESIHFDDNAEAGRTLDETIEKARRVLKDTLAPEETRARRTRVS